MVPQLVTKFSAFYGTKSLLPRSDETAIEPDESSPRPNTLLLEFPF
jgi:hypothetical protein